MQTRFYKVAIFLIIVLGTLPGLIAQEVVPLALEVKREIRTKPYPKSKLRLELWIQEFQKFMGLDSSMTRILVWKDDLEHDLLLSHNNAIMDYEDKVKKANKNGRVLFSSRTKKIIDLSNSVGFRDTIGFKLALENWTVPSKNATKIRIEGRLVY
ncbi:MAG: hypothetical protein KJN76_12595, partial [Eudoraea sp.]|nr:hypothetical protein [Eudoraea sp.]